MIKILWNLDEYRRSLPRRWWRLFLEIETIWEVTDENDIGDIPGRFLGDLFKFHENFIVSWCKLGSSTNLVKCTFRFSIESRDICTLLTCSINVRDSPILSRAESRMCNPFRQTGNGFISELYPPEQYLFRLETAQIVQCFDQSSEMRKFRSYDVSKWISNQKIFERRTSYRSVFTRKILSCEGGLCTSDKIREHDKRT
jgi:hypothetical protein